jgi:putative hemolysin
LTHSGWNDNVRLPPWKGGAARPQSVFELVIAIVLILLNGVFSLSELAVVSSRKSKLKALADGGSRGAATALALANDPGRFLSTVQICITLVGVLAGAFSGAALGSQLTAMLTAMGVPPGLADPVGFGIVISIITYLSVVVGELVPKNFALRNPEGIAVMVAPLMSVVSRVGTPVVWLLDASTKLIFRILGQSSASEPVVTSDEIRSLVAEAESSGTIETHESTMIAGVLRLGDRAVRALMTPRVDVDWIDIDKSEGEIRQTLIKTGHSRLPVSQGRQDNVIGAVQTRELLTAVLSGHPLDVRAHIHPVLGVPDGADALEVLQILRVAEVPMVIVHDEYGHFEGIVTPADVLDAIAGAFKSDPDASEPEAVQREDGSWLLAGSMPVDEMAERLGIALPEGRKYDTLAGFVLDSSGKLPAAGEAIDVLGWRFEVVDLDGRRIDKVMAGKLV